MTGLNRETLRDEAIVRGPTNRLHQRRDRNPRSKQRAAQHRSQQRRVWRCLALVAATGIVVLLASCSLSQAYAEVVEQFESADVTWRLVEEDCSPRVFAHQRTSQQKHSGDFSEVIQFYAGVGTKAYWMHDITPARVLPEFSPSLWVKSNRRGIRLFALVVFPNEPAPNGEGAVQRLVPGPIYERTGSWQKLSFSDLQQDFQALYHRTVQAARLSAADGKFDDRNAFVSGVVLNAYGDEGATAVWIDDLGLDGFVPYEPTTDGNGFAVKPASWQSPEDWASTGRTSIPYRSDSLIIADTRPLMLKVVDHHGEPFEYLKQLGFNTIRLSAAPSLAMNQEAARLKLWLIAPPPRGFRAMADDRAFTRVLAWNLGNQLDRRSELPVAELTQAIRTSPATAGRLLHIEARWSGVELSRQVDLVEMKVTGELAGVLGRSPYEVLRHAIASAPNGTPFLANIPLEPSPQLVRQVAALAGGVPDLEASPQRCKSAVFQSIAAGARGISFQTYTRLDGMDQAAQRRATLARWLNQWLDRLEPWIAGGNREATLTTTRNEWMAVALSTERSRLILMFEREGIAAQPNGRELSILDSTGSNSASAYRVTPSGPIPLVQHRSPGSVNILMPDRDVAEAIVCTQDPLTLQHLNRVTRDENAIQESLELQHDLVVDWISKQSEVHGELDVYQAGSAEAIALYRQALQTGGLAEQHIMRRNFPSAFQTLIDAQRELTASREVLLRNAMGQFPQANPSPLCLDISSLPGHWDLALRLGRADWQGSVLPGGDFEDLNHLIQTGWTNERWGTTEDAIAVNLTNEEMRVGQRSLRLQTTRQLKPTSTGISPPIVRVASAEIKLLPNQVARFHGWIKIESNNGQAQPLVWVEDSLGGPGLGRWIRPIENSWQEFTFYRAAFAEETAQIIFEVEGYGTVLIDDVTVHVASPAGRSIGNEPAPELRESRDATAPLR